MKEIKPITLIATIGSSPAVLTEAVYALHKKGLWPVAEIVIITTSHGVNIIKERLFGESRNWIKLCDEVGVDPFQIKIPAIHELKAVCDEEGNELDDIRNSSDDRLMAANIQQTVNNLTKDKNRRVFALLSGGRKTMSSHLMSAMQLFGRRDDRLFHILVSDPFEKIRDFFFPTKESHPMDLKTMKGDFVSTHDAKDAKIDLIDIPFIRLRSFLETQVDYSKSFDELLAIADQKLLSMGDYPVSDLHVHLNGHDSCIYINGMEYGLQIPDRQMALLAFFIVVKIRHGAEKSHSWKEVILDADLLDTYHILYRTIKLGNLEKLDSDDRELFIRDFEKEDLWMKSSYWFKNSIPQKKSFSKELSELKKNLTSFLETNLPTLTCEHFLRVEGKGELLTKSISSPVPIKNCRIMGLHPSDAEILGLE